VSRPSKFSGMLDATKRGPSDPDGGPVEPLPAAPTGLSPGPPAAPIPAPFALDSAPPAPPEAPAPRAPGRPKGKRSDPAFEQVTAYIPSALYTRVRIALLEDGRRQEFSDVVAELLSGWLGGRGRD